MSSPTLLLTGFEPYGGHDINPSADIVAALDRCERRGVAVAGRVLPVRLTGLAATVDTLLDELRPLAVICLGLAPGAATLRLERIAVNLADFVRPDNAGRQCRGQPLLADGPQALFSTLPLSALHGALLDAGLPARLSDSAGTYLCNAVSYLFLAALRRRGHELPCGFVHLPYLPRQAAAELRLNGGSGSDGGIGNTGPASMALVDQIAAVRLLVEVTLAHCPSQQERI